MSSLRGPTLASRLHAPPPLHGRPPQLWRPRRRRCRAAAQDGSASGGGEEPPSPADLRRRVQQLNELFFNNEAPAGVSDLESAPEEEQGSQQPSAEEDSVRTIRDLCLWRVQWSALVGHQEVLHVHVPHYTSMFERLFRQPRPWRYGHVFLPEGSKNLGNEEYALAPGSKAPLTGTLMEVMQAVRFADGRLIILSVGVGRFRVVRPTQQVPYSRADVELLVDAEEQQLMEPLALRALESVQGGLEGAGSSNSSSSGSSGDSGGCEDAAGEEGLGLAALMSAVPAAAREAAAAYGQAWLEYELSDLRPADGSASALVIDGTRTADAQVMGRRLAAIAGNEVMHLPFFDAVTSAVRADALAAATGEGPAGQQGVEEAGSSSGGGGAEGSSLGSALRAALEAQRPVLRQTEAAAYAQATSAAARSIARQLQGQASGAGSGPGSAAAKAGQQEQPFVLNTAAERGVEVQPLAEVLGEDALNSEPDSPALALKLEAAVWVEIEAVQALAGKLRERGTPLPEGVQCLRPRPAAAGGPATGSKPSSSGKGEGGGPAREVPVAPPDYPALRRAQRLSHACTSLLANVSAAEGRQAWVEAGSICARLRLGLAALRKHRQVLAAVVAVEGL